MKNKKWILGIYFILAAIFMLVNQLGYFNEIDLLSLIFTIVLIPIIISSIRYLNFSGVFFPLAVLGIIYAEPLGIISLKPWTLLFMAGFASIGFTILFPGKWRRWTGIYQGSTDHVYERNHEHFGEVINCKDDEFIDVNVTCHGAIKYINSENFKRFNLYMTLAGAKIYFDKAKPAEKEVEIFINATLSGVELYIPKNWKVVNKINVALAGVEEKNTYNSEAEYTAFLTGNLALAGIEIIYV